MTHLLDTSGLLAHYPAEPGASQGQALFEDDAVVTGVSILSLFEFDLRLHQLGADQAARASELGHYHWFMERENCCASYNSLDLTKLFP